ncbi:MAG: (2Fe-2S) ferredoxin domain-containing protein [Clostridiales bacterium]|jgi:NADP-reducing hydrogenase subunit HndB|nr:(2Fe-2S) ferredoxin domain-containing protein [Clostridiales bacterium]
MKTLEELQAIRDRMKGQMNNRAAADESDYRVVVGMATCGIAAGARNTLSALTQEIEQKRLENVVVSQTGCIGICKYEPIVEVFEQGKEKVTYIHVDAERARQIVAGHIINGKPITEYTYNYAVREEK